MADGGTPRKLTLAQQADLHATYEAAVQTPDIECEYIADTYRRIRGRAPQSLREDFCGTAAIACEWVKGGPRRRAIGVDLDAGVLDWGRSRHFARLKPAQQERVQLVHGDVARVRTDPVDVVGAFNFSYWVFKTRPDMLRYFRRVRDALTSDGIPPSRSMLTEGGLTAVASPRVGRIHILGPDNSRHHGYIEALKAKRPKRPGPGQTYVLHFGSGANLGRGLTFRATMFVVNPLDAPAKINPASDLRKMQLPTFLNERVVYLTPHWATRGEIIKFVANVGSGVHSDTPRKFHELVLDRIRAAIVYDLGNGRWQPRIDLNATGKSRPAFRYVPKSINPVLIEILAAAYYVANSPEVQKLEVVLKRELGITN